MSDAHKACSAAGVVGTGSGDGPEVTGPQLTGLLRSTPRGSNATMSKSSSRTVGMTLSSFSMSLTPDVPGPPGLMTKDPMRAAGSLAGRRSTAIWMVGPSGLL